MSVCSGCNFNSSTESFHMRISGKCQRSSYMTYIHTFHNICTLNDSYMFCIISLRLICFVSCPLDMISMCISTSTHTCAIFGLDMCDTLERGVWGAAAPQPAERTISNSVILIRLSTHWRVRKHDASLLVEKSKPVKAS